MRRGAVLALILVALSEDASEYALVMAGGRKALAAGKTGEARALFLDARCLRPEEPEVLGELLRMDGKDPEARILWAIEAAAASSDAAGRFSLPKGTPPLPAEEATAVKVLLARRVAALQEIRKAAKPAEGPTMGSYQAWLRRLAERLADGSPALRKEFLAELATAEGRCGPDNNGVHAALRACIERGRRPGKAYLGLTAARILRGLRFQYVQRESAEDPKKKVPGGEEILDLDSEIQSFREEILAGLPKPTPAAELLAIPASAGPEFQALHGTWANPGMAISPKGLYRVESTGGLQTLQCVVREVEACHARLAKWFGKDPFPGNQGRIRLRPTYADLESDGAPYWWADGWQQGRLMTVHACFKDALSLSALMTHELTHRFDGALNPGMPAWLVEGRAVHTEIATVSLAASAIDESRFSPGRLLEAYNAGFGGVEELTGLLDGSRDYRDNYTAGYALWLYLTTFRGLEAQAPDPIFATRIPGYVKGFAGWEGGKEAQVARFREAFADGAEGRPPTLKKFAADFGKFLHGIAAAIREQEPPWVGAWRYGMAGRSPLPEKVSPDEIGPEEVDIFDHSNWPESRVRSAPAEPGTDQARLAAALFLGENLPKERVLALEWAVARDEATAGLLEEAAEAHLAVGEAAQAFALRRTAESLFARPPGTATEGAPKELAALLKAVGAVVEHLDAETDRVLGEDMLRLGLALRAERDGLAVLVGTPAKGLPAVVARPPGDAGDTAPLCAPWTTLSTKGLAGKAWAPLGPRPSSNWHRSGETTLVLGSLDDSTGETRTRWQQNVFVENPARLEGTYTVESSWRAGSAYFEGLLVVGKEADDRGMSISIAGGDEEAAIRSLRSGRGLSILRVALSDSRPLEEKFSVLTRDVPLGASSPVVRLTVSVAGPAILVSVNGEPVLRHRRLTGAPIRGTVGFGVRHGTVDVVNPRFRRHRAAGPAQECACGEWDAPVPWDARRSLPFRMLEGRRLEPEATSPGGGVLFWYTEANLPAQMGPKAVKEVLGAARESLRPWAEGFETLVSFPPAGRCLNGRDGAPPSARDVGLATGAAGVHGPQPELAARIWKTATGVSSGEFEKGDLKDERRTVLEEQAGKEIESPYCLWIDPRGIVRRLYPRASAFRVPGLSENLHRYFAGW